MAVPLPNVAFAVYAVLEVGAVDTALPALTTTSTPAPCPRVQPMFKVLVVAPLTLAEEAWTGGAEEDVRGVAVELVEKSELLLSVSVAPRGVPALIITFAALGAGADVVSLAVAVPKPTKSTLVGLATAVALAVPV